MKNTSGDMHFTNKKYFGKIFCGKIFKAYSRNANAKIFRKDKNEIVQKTAQTHLIAKHKKVILENIKTNNSGEEDKPGVSLARENRPDMFLRKTPFQSPTKYCACCAKAKRECLTWGRCLTVFRIICEQAPEISNRTTGRPCQLQGNTKQTH